MNLLKIKYKYYNKICTKYVTNKYYKITQVKDINKALPGGSVRKSGLTIVVGPLFLALQIRHT